MKSSLTRLLTVATVLLSATGVFAQSITQGKYEQQYTNKPGDLLRLDYQTWKSFNDLVNKERNLIQAVDLPTADLSKLRWKGGVQNVEVYFINEGAGYRNQLFFSTNGGDSKTKIFDDISSPLSLLSNSDGPLSLGQGISLGRFQGDTTLEFFLKSNGKNGGQHYFGFNPLTNPDRFPHIMAYNIGDYLLIGFEDLWNGGDKDYNDTVFVVKGVTDQPAAVPEPSSTVALLGLGGLLAKVWQRRSSSSDSD